MRFRFCPVCAGELTPIAAGDDAGLPGCPTGHFVHYDNPAVTAFAFVEDGGSYLALRRAQEPHSGEWDLPGGFVDAGEYPEDCVRREIEEETGLDVGDLEVLGAWISEYGDGGKWTVDVGYRCHLAGGTFALSAEKAEARWATLEDFPEPAFNGERLALALLRRRGRTPCAGRA